MRNCPDCNVPMVPTNKTFAEIDVCPQCNATFLDSGEGVSAFGPDAEVKFLLEDGRAKKVGHSNRKCPAGHPAMTTFGIKASAERYVEVDLCTECGGFFFDAGEGEALAALDNAPPSTFAAPPRMSTEDFVIAEARQKGQSFFARFVMDFVSGSGERRRK